MTPLDGGRVRLSGRHAGVTYDVVVTGTFVRKYHPHLGGYYTRDTRGHVGFRTAVAFEDRFQQVG